MRLFILGLAIIPFIWANQSCKSTNETDLYACDTTSVTFSNDIVPILENKCYKCHSDANASLFGDGIDLEGYDDLMNYVTYAPTGKPIVLANVQHDTSHPDHSPMPKGDDMLPQCEIDKIEAWINKGSKND